MEPLVSICTFLLHVLYWILYPFYILFNCTKPRSIPPFQDPLLKLSATIIAQKIREGEISSQVVVAAYIKRIKEVNTLLNAVVEDRFEAALCDAKACDEKIKNEKVTALTLAQEKPLYGVPFTVKESCSLKGLSHTAGCLARRNVKAPADSFVVETLKNAGAIPLCVTNVPEMCAAFHTENYLFGSTSNPYDIRHTSGGSSGGETALLGAGASLIGIGSDIAGSIRIPGYFSGVFGHKPTRGIIPITGHFPNSDDAEFQNLLVLGPNTRFADDLHLSIKVLAAKYEVALRLDDPVDFKHLNVFYMEQIDSPFNFRKPTWEIRNCIKQASNYLGECGADVQELPQDWFADMYHTLMAVFFGVELPTVLLSTDPKQKKKALWELVKSIFGLSQHCKSAILTEILLNSHGMIPSSKLPQYKRHGEEFRQKLNGVLKDNGVLILPTFPTAAPLKGLTWLKIDAVVYCVLANVMGLPATQVPMGLNRDGLPIGFQVISASHQDRLGLAVAKALENVFGGWVPPGE